MCQAQRWGPRIHLLPDRSQLGMRDQGRWGWRGELAYWVKGRKTLVSFFCTSQQSPHSLKASTEQKAPPESSCLSLGCLLLWIRVRPHNCTPVCKDVGRLWVWPPPPSRPVWRCSVYMSFNKSYVWAGLPWWLSGKEPTCQCRRHGFNPWVRKIRWTRKWQLTLVFLHGKPHGQRNLVGYSPWGCKRFGHNLATKQQSCMSSFWNFNAGWPRIFLSLSLAPCLPPFPPSFLHSPLYGPLQAFAISSNQGWIIPETRVFSGGTGHR